MPSALPTSRLNLGDLDSRLAHARLPPEAGGPLGVAGVRAHSPKTSTSTRGFLGLPT